MGPSLQSNTRCPWAQPASPSTLRSPSVRLSLGCWAQRDTETETERDTAQRETQSRENALQRHRAVTERQRHREKQHETQTETKTQRSKRTRVHSTTIDMCAKRQSLAIRLVLCFLNPCGKRSGGISLSLSQLFSDPGKKGNPFFGKTILVGQPPKKGKTIGATEQLSSPSLSPNVRLWNLWTCTCRASGKSWFLLRMGSCLVEMCNGRCACLS